METIEQQRTKYYAGLKRQNRNPLDIFSQPALHNLETEVRAASEHREFTNEPCHRATRQFIYDVLLRRRRIWETRDMDDRHDEYHKWRKRAYHHLKKEGLNPFDLLSWDALINLEYVTRWAGKTRNFDDYKIHGLTRKMIWDALDRRSEYRDYCEGGDRWSTMVDELKSEV